MNTTAVASALTKPATYPRDVVQSVVPRAPKMEERVSGASALVNSSAHTSKGVLAKNGLIWKTHRNAYQKTNTTRIGANRETSRLSRPGSWRGAGTAPRSSAGDHGHRIRPSAPIAM